MYVLNNACNFCTLTPNWEVCMVIHVLVMVNFEKDIKPTIIVTQNLPCFIIPSIPPSPDLSRPLSHIGGRIDKQLGTMEVHKRHVEHCGRMH